MLCWSKSILHLLFGLACCAAAVPSGGTHLGLLNFRYFNTFEAYSNECVLANKYLVFSHFFIIDDLIHVLSTKNATENRSKFTRTEEKLFDEGREGVCTMQYALF